MKLKKWQKNTVQFAHLIFLVITKILNYNIEAELRELKNLKPVGKGDSDLNIAMKLIATSGKGPKNQIPSMGCNIKWFK